jgi:hypothetical protein
VLDNFVTLKPALQLAKRLKSLLIDKQQEPMKRTLRLIITLGLAFVLALCSAALTYSTPPALQGDFGDSRFFIPYTSAPPPQDTSEIGSTDGIVIMGFVIALIVVIPILIRRKEWMENR